jgi:hypothetical protein
VTLRVHMQCTGDQITQATRGWLHVTHGYALLCAPTGDDGEEEGYEEAEPGVEMIAVRWPHTACSSNSNMAVVICCLCVYSAHHAMHCALCHTEQPA